MTDKLKILLKNQNEEFTKLLKLLETQKKMILSKDVMGLEGIVDEIQFVSKEIAKIEIERRKITGDKKVKEIVKASNDESLESIYSNLRETLDKLAMQKETNDLLLKQELLFTNKMLALMNPDKQIKTYNSYGSIRK